MNLFSFVRGVKRMSIYDKDGVGTRALAENFGKESVQVIISPGTYYSSVAKTDDIDLRFAITEGPENTCGNDGRTIYVGAVLIRNGKVHYYDRSPVSETGRKLHVSDFKDPNFRRRAELISENIERLLTE